MSTEFGGLQPSGHICLDRVTKSKLLLRFDVLCVIIFQVAVLTSEYGGEWLRPDCG